MFLVLVSRLSIRLPYAFVSFLLTPARFVASQTISHSCAMFRSSMAGRSSDFARKDSSRRSTSDSTKTKSKSSRSSRGGDSDRGLGDLEDASAYSTKKRDLQSDTYSNGRERSSRPSSDSKTRQTSRAVDENEADYDSHIPHQFPGQFPGTAAAPFLPNQTGEAADYYGGQGQSVSQQPYVRPNPPEIIPNSQAHLTTASGEQHEQLSNTGDVGAAAEYYDANATFGPHPSEQGNVPNRPYLSPSPSDYNLVSAHGDHTEHENSSSSTFKPALGAAAAAAAAGYAVNNHHHHDSNENQPSRDSPPASYSPGPYYASANYHGQQSGPMAFQKQRRRHSGPFGGFVDFWKDPVGVGQFEDYTEAIGLCKYCFDPGTSSRDAPRRHHYYHHRHSYSDGRDSRSVRIDERGRYVSSSDDDRGLQPRSSKGRRMSSWLPAMFGGGIGAGDTSRSVVGDDDDDNGYYVGDSRSAGRRGSSSSKEPSRSILKGAAAGVALGAATRATSKPSSRGKSLGRSGSLSSSSSSSAGLSRRRRPRNSGTGGLGYFFTAPSANRRRKRRVRTSTSRGRGGDDNTSSSSLDADLIFGSTISSSSRGTNRSDTSRRRRRKSGRDIDAELSELGASPTALAAGSSRRGDGRRSGEVLANRRGRSRGASSGTENDAWVDLESESEQSSSSVSTNLAYGDSGSESGSYSYRSISGPAWLWGWAGAQIGKADNSREVGDRRQLSSYSDAPSLQNVYPIATSDPSRFDAARMPPSSSYTGVQQPPLVRPGGIPLQQPQPVTPVSQSVYYTQPESQTISAPAPSLAPLIVGDASQNYRQQGSRDIDLGRGTEPVASSAATSSRRRRPSDSKDLSTVQFDLTKEQEEKLRQLEYRERRRRDGDDSGVPQGREITEVQRKVPAAVAGGLAGAIGSAVLASEFSGSSKADDNDNSGPRRYSEYRQRRRAERRQSASESRSGIDSNSSISSIPSSDKRQRPSREVVESSTQHDDYASFFAPEELRRGQEARDRQLEKNSIGHDYLPKGVENESSTAAEWRNVSQANALPQFTLNPPTPEGSLVSGIADDAHSQPALSEKASREVKDVVGKGTGVSRPTSSRVSWGEHQTHEYEVLSSASEEEDQRRQFTSPRRSAAERGRLERASQSGFPEPRYSSDYYSSDSNKRDATTTPDYNRNVDFTATVAAATQATGFDPRMVTVGETYASSVAIAGPTTTTPYYSPWSQQPDSRGFVEGEVEDQSLLSGRKKKPRDDRGSSSREKDLSHDGSTWSTTSRNVQDDDYGPKSNSKSRSHENVQDKDSYADTGFPHDGLEGKSAASYGMPGGFEGEFSEEAGALKSYDDETGSSSSKRDITTSYDGQDDDNKASRRERRRRSKRGDAESIEERGASYDQDSSSSRPRQRSKRDSNSGSTDDLPSVTSSPATRSRQISDQRSMDNEGDSTSIGFGGFLSNFLRSPTTSVDKTEAGVDDYERGKNRHSSGLRAAGQESDRESYSSFDSGNERKSSSRGQQALEEESGNVQKV